ncbi:MAG: hypothetical protein AAGB46_18560 [Verrucomicrobiota bacterium]
MQRSSSTLSVDSMAAWLMLLGAIFGLCACETTERIKDYRVSVARFVLEADEGNEYASIAEMPVSRVRIPVNGKAVLSEFDILDVQVAEVEFGKCLVFGLTQEAGRAFMRDSSLSRGKRLVLLLNGRPIGARRIQAPITDGRVYIFLETKDENLEEIARDIRGTSLDAQRRIKK